MSITGIGPIGFGGMSSMDCWILQSHQNLRNILPDFEKAIEAGYNPNNVKDEIFKAHNLTESDFTELDKKELVKKVDAIWKAKLRKEGR